MSQVFKKPVSSLTVVAALTVKPISYTDYKGKPVSVPINKYVYVDTAIGVALIDRDHVDIGEDEYRLVCN